MTLAIFDLDHTLINGDSDYAWGEFVADKGLVDSDSYRSDNERFFHDYKAGKLDMVAYQEFVLAPMSRFTLDELEALHREFMATKISPMRLPKADRLLNKHRKQGDQVLIITATNRFITAPIARALGVEHLIATEGEIKNNRLTGKIKGTPCYQQGKVERLEAWMREHGQSLKDSYFYSDSHNDLPLLKIVSNAVAVDPDDTLRSYAQRMQWPIISLREPALSE
jgi:HAD superfamily hydrolase (TIGR01490 family)